MTDTSISWPKGSTWPSGIGRLLDPNLVARRLAPCRMVICATPRFLARHGALSTVADLRRAPRVAFGEAVSAGDWRLTDPSGQMHLIDGPAVTAANNTQMQLARGEPTVPVLSSANLAKGRHGCQAGRRRG